MAGRDGFHCSMYMMTVFFMSLMGSVNGGTCFLLIRGRRGSTVTKQTVHDFKYGLIRVTDPTNRYTRGYLTSSLSATSAPSSASNLRRNEDSGNNEQVHSVHLVQMHIAHMLAFASGQFA
jgi:hypothetical protein